MDFSFIHAADIHLDSPLRGLERYEGAPVDYIRAATRRAFQNLVDLALKEKVCFVLIAGDLYDGDWRDYNTGLFFTSQAARLKEADINLYFIRGNHDAASQITRMLRLPDNVKDFSTAAPETVTLDDLGVALHGQGFHTPAVTEDLSRNYPGPIKDYFNIGLLHTCASGREGHEPYAPCDLSHLKNIGYDYWALGHVHRREVISENPAIIFPGNIQGRHIREQGAKGCTLVQVQQGRINSVEHHPLDVLRWVLCQVDAEEAETYEEVLERAGQSIDSALSQSEGRLLALRVIISGACQVHGSLLNDPFRLNNDLRAVAVDRGIDSAWVEKVKVNTSPRVNMDELLSSNPVASLLQYLHQAAGDEQILKELISELERDKKNLPPELFKDGEIDPGDPGYLQKLLPEVEELILSRLMRKEGLGQ